MRHRSLLNPHRGVGQNFTVGVSSFVLGTGGRRFIVDGRLLVVKPDMK
jgi:hypothetical protein